MASTRNVVDEFYDNYVSLLKLLEAKREISLQSWAGEFFRRIIVLVAANHLESEVKSILRNLVKTKSGEPKLESFLDASMERQYHTYFQWNKRNANAFLGRFGKSFKEAVERDVEDNEELEVSIKAFMEIGDLRNTLLHEKLLEVTLEKSVDDFYQLHNKALLFIGYLKTKLV